jgi:hypothetical protein
MIKSVEEPAKITIIKGDKIFAIFNICGGAFDTDKLQCKDDKYENRQRQIILEVL